MISVEAIYKSNENFKQYVNKYAIHNNILVSEALTHKMVREVAEHYLKLGIGTNDEKRI